MKNEPIDVGVARQAIEAEQRKRIEACTTDVQAVLEKHSCTLRAFAVITTGTVEMRIEIVPAG